MKEKAQPELHRAASNDAEPWLSVRRLFLPGALLMAIGTQLLAAFVLVYLRFTAFFQ